MEMEETMKTKTESENGYEEEGLPAGMFASAYYRYLQAYFPKRLEAMKENGGFVEEMQQIEDEWFAKWNDLVDRQMEREGLHLGPQGGGDTLTWTGRVNNIRSSMREVLMQELCPYSIDLEFASEEEDYDEDAWFEAMNGGIPRFQLRERSPGRMDTLKKMMMKTRNTCRTGWSMQKYRFLSFFRWIRGKCRGR